MKRVVIHCLLGLLMTALFMQATASQAAAQDVETRIKAAFLYHFCNYIDWPESAFAQTDSPLVLGVAGSASMVGALREVVDNRVAHNRPMLVRQVNPGDSLDGVHLLFIAEAAQASSRRLISAATDRSVLVVTEGPGGLDAGGMISFVIQDDRVRFDIAPDVVRQRNLGISAQLLTVARVIRQDSG